MYWFETSSHNNEDFCVFVFRGEIEGEPARQGTYCVPSGGGTPRWVLTDNLSDNLPDLKQKIVKMLKAKRRQINRNLCEQIRKYSA
jgi:hypothetical protein